MHCIMVFPWQWGAQVEKLVVVEGGGRIDGSWNRGQHLRCVVNIDVESPRGVFREGGWVTQTGQQTTAVRKGHHLLHFTGFENVVQ